MKYCRDCGTEIADIAVICPKCGKTQVDYETEQLKLKAENEVLKEKFKKQKSAAIEGKGLGFVLTFFIGLIGLILCLALGDDDCKKSALITFIVTIILSVIFVIIYILFLTYIISSSGNPNMY